MNRPVFDNLYFLLSNWRKILKSVSEKKQNIKTPHFGNPELPLSEDSKSLLCYFTFGRFPLSPINS
jgi:hypothetical protein